MNKLSISDNEYFQARMHDIKDIYMYLVRYINLLILSPPKSKVLITSGLLCKTCSAVLYILYCSSSDKSLIQMKQHYKNIKRKKMTMIISYIQ